MKKVTVIQCNDWEAIYIGNELHRQDDNPLYSSELEDLFKDLEVDVDFEIIEDVVALDDFLVENGSLPETLREVKKLLT